MKKFCLGALIVVSLLHSAQAQIPSILIKVKEKSGFLGLGPPRFVQLHLSSQNQKLPLTSDNVNSGQYYYFIVETIGDWKLDDDFMREDLPKLTLVQGGRQLPVIWKGAITKGDTSSTLPIGFAKELKFNESFAAQFELGGTKNLVEFKVPQIYWPGYSTITNTSQEADNLIIGQKYTEAIRLYNKILENKSLAIFAEYAELREKRTQAFENYFNGTFSAFKVATDDTQLPLKEKITAVDKHRPLFQFVIDSLPNTAFNVPPSDPLVGSITLRARDALQQTLSVRDSLQRVLDEENTRWIVQGSSSGKPLYLYQSLIKILAYAFSSLNFADTSTTKLKVNLRDELQTELTKGKLTEDYESFLRICSARFQLKQPIFPADFLPNLRKDTASFPMPYYAILKAIEDFYYKDFASARQEIFRILRTSYDVDLNAKFDQMRVLIDLKTGNVPLDVMKLLDEAEQAESRNDNQAALEKYQQAMRIAPNFAYSAYQFGKYYLRTREPIRALTFFRRAYQLDKFYLNAYREVYNYYIRGGTYKPIIDVLTEALQNGNNYWETNFQLGMAYGGDGDFARAIQHFERALALNSYSYQTNIQLGLAYQNLKKYKQARDYFTKAIELDPDRQEAIEYIKKLEELERGPR